MEKPNYVLRATEAIWTDKHDSKVLRNVRTTTYIIIVVIIVATVLFQENIFMELSWRTKMLLVGLGITTITTRGTIRRPSEFELQFYQDYLVVYREKFFYNRDFARKKIEKIYYKDVKKIQYRQKTQRINLFGINEGIYWDYKKDGTLSEEPSYNKTMDGVIYFYTALSDVDFIKEIEAHSPLRVEIRNS